MEFVLSLIIAIAREFLIKGLIQNLPVLILGIILVAWQYRKMQYSPEASHPFYRQQYLRMTAMSAGAGIAGGFLGSIMLVFLGLDLSAMGLFYVLLLALLLMLIHPRFLCFAYAGGILSLSNILLGYPEINVAQLMALVAILHMIESVLILFTGHLYAAPVFIYRENTGAVGGFNLQKFWPIPLVAMANGMVSGSSLELNWWPLMNHGSAGIDAFVNGLLPVLAILGYGEVTTTSPPRMRSRTSALYLMLFSLVLLALSVLAARVPDLLILPAVFGPLGHELVIAVGMYTENSRKPLYVDQDEGVMVLDVMPGSPAEEAGIKRQDIILTANGKRISGRAELYETLADLEWAEPLTLTLLREGQLRVVSLLPGPGKQLGVLLVPERESPGCYGLHYASPLLTLVKRIKRFIP